MRVLFVGALWLGSNARSLRDGFCDIGAEVRSIDITAMSRAQRSRARRLRRRLPGPVDDSVNSELSRLLATSTDGWRPDLLVCFKTVMFNQELLLSTLAGRRLHYSPDDASNPDNVTDDYLQFESSWDAIVTTKRHNLAELEQRGAQAALYVDSAFDPRIHYGSPVSGSRRYFVGFIGAARPDRSTLPSTFSSWAPRESVIYGPRWRRQPSSWYARGVDMLPQVDGAHFATAASGITTGLVLLNSANRDQHTCRSYEMPACGLVTLAERTSEHQAMLEENHEALFFDSLAEAKAQLDRLRSDLWLAQQISTAGQKRIVGGNNTYAARARQITEDLG